MSYCKAYKNKIEKVQCTNKIKSGSFCGKHKNNTQTPIFDDNGNIINIINAININPENNIISNLSDISDLSDLSDIITKENNANIIASENANVNNIHVDNERYKLYKTLEKTDIYANYLQQRKTYIKDNCRENAKPIELLEYIENNKIDYYPNSRILASLEYYKLIKKTDISKFMMAVNNTNLLISLFETLIKVNLNIDKLIKLQRWVKRSLYKYNAKIHGPALYNRSICVNDSDFVSLDELKDIPECDFFSFRDDTGFIYGYHIDSAIELIFKSDENYYENFKKHSSNLCYKQFIKTLFNHYNKIKIFNPYTRFIIDGATKLNIIRLHAQRVFKLSSKTTLAVPVAVDMKTAVRNKCFAVFQKIDFQGYFTDTAWLMEENPKNIKDFYKKLASLWNFEFGLNNTARYKIARTHNLFNNINEIIASRCDKYVLLDKILDVVNIIVSNGETEGDRNTGCILILYGLAYINRRCILANPWLA